MASLSAQKLDGTSSTGLTSTATRRADGKPDVNDGPNEEKMVVSGPVTGRTGLEAAEQSGITDSRMQHHAHQAAVGALHPSQASEAAQA